MTGRVPRHPGRGVLTSCLVAVLLLPASPVAAAVPPDDALSAVPLGAVAQLSGTPKGSQGASASGRVAHTDPELLARTDAERVPVLVKLDHDASASYAGGVAGLAATSPRVTGTDLTGATRAERAYTAYQKAREEDVVAELLRAVPSADIRQRLRTVYGGIAATVPAADVERILAIDGVTAVQIDEPRRLLTDAGPAFVGAPALYPGLGGVADAGRGVLYGNIDSGVWPEHPSFADLGNLEPPPGPARECDYGDNPLTPAVDPFTCTNKLVGGATFLETYLSDPARAQAEPFHTARDSNGHGTHTASTSAGNVVPDVALLGLPKPQVQGVAPGAWVMEYKACGIELCYSSDTAAAVQQAILDGVDVLNFSIDGGKDPFTDPVELAFLDAYEAGIFVAASAGNTAGADVPTDHASPWVTTVAASTHDRRFTSVLTLSAGGGSGGATATFEGASVTAGTGDAPLPVVAASEAPYDSARCESAAPAGLFTGRIVACERGGNGRAAKSFNVARGGAVGMVLYNAEPADVVPDTHWVPTVHLADGTALMDFLAAHPDAVGSLTAGGATPAAGDVMWPSSSRGVVGSFLKPDLTAPGVQVLAGDSPMSEQPALGPPGEYFQSMDGTSMSSPHVAGAAVLVRATHPDWTPGQAASALMTTAVTDVVKADGRTPADPLDMGAGRIDVAAAAGVTMTLDESAQRFRSMAADPLQAVDLNLPSISAPVMPGRLTTTRTLTNTGRRPVVVRVSGQSGAGATVEVTPRTAAVRPGRSLTLTVTLSSDAPLGSEHFGAVLVEPVRGKAARLRLPVAFVHTHGDVELTQDCAPAVISRHGGQTSTCTVRAVSTGAEDRTVDLSSTVGPRLGVTAAVGAEVVDPRHVRAGTVTVTGARPPAPTVAAGAAPFDYVPLDALRIPLTPVGDEDVLDIPVPRPFVYDGQSWTRIRISSNGFVVVGDVELPDAACCDQPDGPDPAPPNNVLAPFWTDLDGTGAPGVLAGLVTSGDREWAVVEHRVNVAGTQSRRTFQVWIGLGAEQDISYAYPPDQLPADPAGQPFLVGAENASGAGTMVSTLPTVNLVVTSGAATPGGSASYSFTVVGRARGGGPVTTEMLVEGVPGVTVVRSTVDVRGR